MTVLSRLRNPNLRNIAVYGVATGVAAVLTLVMTRVLWRALTPEDFGVWSLVDPMLLPAASLVLLGVDHAIVKQLRVDGIPLRVVTGTLLTTTVPATALCLLAAGLMSGFVFHLGWTTVLLLTMAGEALILMMQSAFRATGAVYGFAALLLARNLLYLIVLLIAQTHSNAAPLSLGLVFLARGLCVVAVSLAAVVGLRPQPTINLRLYVDALLYGFPLLLTTFIFALSDMTDRWFLAEFTGVIPAGIYALHLKLAAILSQAIVTPFGLWFPPERFKRLQDADGGRKFFVRTAVVLAIICSYLSGCVWLGRDLLLSLIAPGVDVSALTLACCLGAVICLALSQALNVGLLLPGHTGKNVICTIFAVIASIGCCVVFVPLLGMNGAAISRIAAALVLLCTTVAWSKRVLPVEFPIVEIALYVFASGTAVLGINLVLLGHGAVHQFAKPIIWSVVTALLGGRLLRKTRSLVPKIAQLEP